MKPGIYAGLPMSEYLRLPAVSNSMAQTALEKCPRAAWFCSWMNPEFVPEADTSDEQDAGTIAHSILLEGNAGKCVIVDPVDHTGPRGGIPVGWTNDSIKAVRDQARAEGKIPILKHKYAKVERMIAAARRYIETLRETEPAIWSAFQPEGGDRELTVVWEEGASLCRIRPDVITTDRKLIVDAKFTGTSAEPDSWGRGQMVRMGYYTGAAFYRRGVHATWGVEDCEYNYLVVEDEPPHLCSLVGVDPAAFALGAAKVRAGLMLWHACVESGQWPGYPTRVAYPELPPWEVARWVEQGRDDETDAQGIPYDVSKLFQKSR